MSALVHVYALIVYLSWIVTRPSDWSVRLLLNAKWAMMMMMMSALYHANTVSWIFRVLAE